MQVARNPNRSNSKDLQRCELCESLKRRWRICDKVLLDVPMVVKNEQVCMSAELEQILTSRTYYAEEHAKERKTCNEWSTSSVGSSNRYSQDERVVGNTIRNCCDVTSSPADVSDGTQRRRVLTWTCCRCNQQMWKEHLMNSSRNLHEDHERWCMPAKTSAIPSCRGIIYCVPNSRSLSHEPKGIAYRPLARRKTADMPQEQVGARTAGKSFAKGV